MAQITKHVGRVGDKKVAVIFRELPGEPHMALVVYTQLLNRHLHDAVMECIQSDSGQQAENLADALNHVYSREGKVVLHQLHADGLLKKIQTELVTMTPTPSNKHDVKLSDLNDIINKMNAGEQAAKELAEMDASMGMQDPVDVARRMRENKERKAQSPVQPQQTTQAQQVPQPMGRTYAPSDMSDAAIAWRLRQQANKMAAEGRGLLNESQRMMQEADAMEGIVSQPAQAVVEASQPKTRARKSKAESVVVAPTVVEAPQPKRGRPARAKSTVQA